MKRFSLLSLLLTLIFAGGQLSAQFDDLYYDPDTDDGYYYNYDDDEDYYDDDYYDDDSYDDYDYWSDYDGYYSSRIRRFRNPHYNFGFYSTLACNSFWYDPFDVFYAPYASFGYSPYWGWGGNSFISINFGFPSYHGYYGGWNPYRFRRSGFYDPFFYNPYFRVNNYYNACVAYSGGGYYGNYYGNNGYTGGFNNGITTGNPNGSYYGSRRGGSTSSSVQGERRTPRVSPRENANFDRVGQVERDSRMSVIPREENDRKEAVRRQSDHAPFTENTISRNTQERKVRKSTPSRSVDESTSPAVRRAEQRKRPSQSYSRDNSSRKTSVRSGNSSRQPSNYTRPSQSTNSRKSIFSGSRSNFGSGATRSTSKSSSRSAPRRSGSGKTGISPRRGGE